MHSKIEIIAALASPACVPVDSVGTRQPDASVVSDCGTRIATVRDAAALRKAYTDVAPAAAEQDLTIARARHVGADHGRAPEAVHARRELAVRG